MTSTISSSRPRRPRRIAADEAHAWARNLRLNNPYAKLVLSMLTLYVDGDGKCFVGIDALAEDTELSADTVRKRLAWLETVGAVVRIPQWVDGSGGRNGDGKGKRTTDEIRLQMSADAETIERRALGDISESTEPEKNRHEVSDATISPRSQQGQQTENKAECNTISPRPALGQPSHCSEGLDSLNHEPEPSPPTPSGGVGQQVEDLGKQASWPHAESWAKVEEAWNDPILHQDTCRDLWTAFSEIERERFLRVIRGYLAWRLKQPKLPNRCNIQKLMRERDAWAAYEKLAGPDPSLRMFVIEGSAEHRAMQVICRVGGWSDPNIKFDDAKGSRGFWLKTPPRPDELAMAQFFDLPVEQWTTLERGTKSFYAWSDRLFEWMGARRDVLKVPILYPPRKDGSLSQPLADTG